MAAVYGTGGSQRSRAKGKVRLFREQLDEIRQIRQILQVLHVRQSCLVRYLGLKEVHTDAAGNGQVTIDYRRIQHPEIGNKEENG